MSKFPNESEFHKAFEKWLERAKLVYVTSAMHTATTQKPGEPDYFVIANGKVLCIELKTAKGRLSAAQVKRHAEYANAGTTVHVIRDIDAAVNIVVEWRSMVGAPKPHATSKTPSEEGDVQYWQGKRLVKKPGADRYTIV